jgi:hypothetical protein
MSAAPVGPVEYVVLKFPGNKFKGEIIPALGELVESNTIRVIDLVFIYKDADGNVAAMELEEVDDEGAKGMSKVADAGGLLNDEDIEIAADGLEDNSSGAVMLFENVWAAKFVDAVRNADGELVANARIPHDIVEAAHADLAANPS